MASYYVRSGAGGAANGTSWADAYTTLATALSGKAAGDIFYIADDHAESTAGAVSLTSPGTNANPCFFYCADRTGSVPPVAADLRTTASIATTVNNAITITGAAYFYGVIFTNGNSSGSPLFGLGAGGTGNLFLDNCSVRIGSSGAGQIVLGSANTGSKIIFNNTTAHFAGTTGSITVASCFEWRNTPSALGGAAVPATLFAGTSSRGGSLLCRGVDFSAAGSGKTLVGAMTGSTGIQALFIDCKLNASVTKAATPATPGTIELDFVRCGASGVAYDQERYRYAGTLTPETTIVRTGGASDGITPIAWKVVTTANCRWTMPFECPTIDIWNTVDGSPITVTIEGTWASGSLPNNDEIWVDVMYLGDNSSPQGSIATDSKATNLTAGSAQTSSSETWGGGTTEFKLEATFTPQQVGPLAVIVKVGKASDTFYIDPKVTIT